MEFIYSRSEIREEQRTTAQWLALHQRQLAALAKILS